MLPEGYAIRRATMTDLDAVLKLRRAKELEDWDVAYTTAEDLREQWRKINFEIDTWIVTSSSGEVIAFAQIFGAGSETPTLYAVVKPEHQRFGIGRHLLALTEARVKAAKRDVPSETPKTLYVQVCGRDRNAQRILKLAGFQLGSTFQIMECEMESEPPTPTPIDSIDVRTFVVGNDEEAVYEADEEAFLDEYGKEPRTFTQWSRRLNMHDGFDSSLWFVAWDGEQVAGAAMSEPENGKGRVHHLGVRRPWRKRGLGMALMHHTMRAFYQRGVRTMILNVHAQSLTNANKLYERAGFKVVNDYHHYKKSLS